MAGEQPAVPLGHYITTHYPELDDVVRRTQEGGK